MPKLVGVDYSGNPIGTVISIGYGTTPLPGTLLADGSLKNIVDYPHLFARLGYAWGGSGPQFAVPDTRGLHERGIGTNGTVQMSQGGGAFAAGAASPGSAGYMQDQNANHAHTYNFTTFSGQASVGTGQVSGPSGSTNPDTSFEGGVEARPVSFPVNYVIAYI